MLRNVVMAVLALSALAVQPTFGHGVARAWLQVPGARAEAGQPFELWGADFTFSSPIDVVIVSGERTYPVGQVLAGDDGHFTTNLHMPAEVPDGYGELVATDASGAQASVWVAVGNVARAPGPPTPSPLTDPSALTLGVLLAGGLVALGYLGLRRRARHAASRVSIRTRAVVRRQTGLSSGLRLRGRHVGCRVVR